MILLNSLFRVFSLFAMMSLVAGLHTSAKASHDITKTGLTIEIEDYFRLPVTRPGSIPLAKKTPNWRPNFIREEPGGSNRLFVNDLYGQLFTVDKNSSPGNILETEFLNLNNVFSHIDLTGSFAAGFVTFEFHPDYANNGKFYTVHSEDPHSQGSGETPVFVPPALGGALNTNNVLVEWTATNPASNVFSGTHRELLRVGSRTPTHPMGDLTFNPLAQPTDADYGMLYVAIGDGQVSAAGTQRLDTFRSSILRIDPDPNGQSNVSSNGAYSIPSDNPWASDGDANTFGEIYAYGFRNVHRMSWDQQTGDLYAMDIGQAAWEEVNRIEAGGNYGWRDREGTSVVNPNNPDGDPLPANDASFGYSYPVAQYDLHSAGFPASPSVAIAGGFVYQGSANPLLQGKFIFGDIPNGQLFYADAADLSQIDISDPTQTLSDVDLHELQIVFNGQDRELIDIVSDALGTTATRADLRLGIDDAGELYIMTKQDGWIRRLVIQESPFSADFDSDFDVDGEDLTQWAGDFGLNGSSDADDDGDSDGADFLAWQRQFGSDASSAASSAAVPEPSVFMLAVAGLLSSTVGRKRKNSYRVLPSREELLAI